MNQTELDQLMGFHEQWFESRSIGQRLELHDRQLDGLRLATRRLHEAHFERVSFRRCILTETALLRSRLIDCDFTECLGGHSRFSDARIANCSFQNGQLQHSQFDGTVLTGCTFTGANLTSAFFVKTDMEDCLLEDATLNDI